jgi:hypothetical protein
MIYEFKPMKDDTIELFYSDIGNSDVPYPYAVGKTHIYILLDDHVAVSMNFFDLTKPIYEQYYHASSYLPMCLKGSQPTYECEDRKAARARIQELKQASKTFKVKVLQKRS